MSLQRCVPCGGSGKMMGGGMLLKDCEHCEGKGKINIDDEDLDILLGKQTEHYQKAKAELQAIAPSMNGEEVEKILDEEIKKESRKDDLITKKPRKETYAKKTDV